MSIYKGDNLIAGPVLNTDVAPDPIPTEGSPRHVMSGGVYDALLPKEDAANKTTVVDASSTNDQYPSAKAAYDALMTCKPVNIEYARDLYTLDWQHAVGINWAELLHGYAAPKRGIFIGSTIPHDTEEAVIALNGIRVGYNYRSTVTDIQTMPINLPVAAGNVILSNVRMELDAPFGIFFVPYKAD